MMIHFREIFLLWLGQRLAFVHVATKLVCLSAVLVFWQRCLNRVGFWFFSLRLNLKNRHSHLKYCPFYLSSLLCTSWSVRMLPSTSFVGALWNTVTWIWFWESLRWVKVLLLTWHPPGTCIQPRGWHSFVSFGWLLWLVWAISVVTQAKGTMVWHCVMMVDYDAW